MPGATRSTFLACGLQLGQHLADKRRDQTRLLVDRCAELGLLSTGSSDFHGPEHGLMSRFRAFDTYGLAPVLGPLAG